MLPELRFPEFEGEWKEKRTKQIAPLQRGFDLPTSDVIVGNYPVVYSNGILRKHNECKVKAPGVVTGRSGTIGKVTYVEKDFWPHNTSLWVTDFYDNNPKFIYYFYLVFNLNKYNAGSTVPTLNRNDVHFVKKRIPTLPEQTRIATFLTAVDKRINLLQKKKVELEQYKKGVMQQLFPPAGGQAPEIRFKQDDGNDFPDWEEKKLGEIFERITRKNKEQNLNVLTISAQMGLVNQLNYFNNSVAGKDVTGYYLLHKNDFAYNRSYSKGYPMGATKRLKYYDKGIVSTLYICFKCNSAIISSFAEQLFETGILNKELYKIAQEGARNHGLLNMNIGDFFNIKTEKPCIAEQQKIASFLSSIDKSIDRLDKQIEQTQQWKKGLLQKMFV